MNSSAVFRTAAAVMAVVGTLKFTWIFVEAGFNPAVSPWGFLLLFTLPFVVVVLLGRRHRRAAAWVMVPFSLGTFLFMAIGIAQAGFALDGWGDILAGYVGGTACAIGLIAAIRTLAVRPALTAH
jgi:hypothetical protein